MTKPKASPPKIGTLVMEVAQHELILSQRIPNWHLEGGLVSDNL